MENVTPTDAYHLIYKLYKSKTIPMIYAIEQCEQCEQWMKCKQWEKVLRKNEKKAHLDLIEYMCV